jgi:hypothetical protein
MEYSKPVVTLEHDGKVWRIVVHHSANWIERSGPFESEDSARAVALSLAKALAQMTTKEDD